MGNRKLPQRHEKLLVHRLTFRPRVPRHIEGRADLRHQPFGSYQSLGCFKFQMSREKTTCKFSGCTKMTMSLGRKKACRIENVYDKDGFLERKRLVCDHSFYSRYCRFHQKRYNRLSTVLPLTAWLCEPFAYNGCGGSLESLTKNGRTKI